MYFDGRVVVITGAGAGLGRSHALEFARRGARVVVNDLGVSTHGENTHVNSAELVAAEIRAEGGESVVNNDSVENGEAIIKTAIEHYGRVDVLVNNAGILRDSSFSKMTDDDWVQVHKVHVLGAYKTSHAAWQYMREQNYGRIINTSSAAGIYGNFGQANYSSAKSALIGLTQTLAVEGGKRNIMVNAIAPLAGSRMMATIMPERVVSALKPEFVTPLVVKLCSADNKESGSIFEVGAGWVSKLRWQRSAGVFFAPETGFSAEDVEAAWNSICDFTDAQYPSCPDDSFAQAFRNLQISLTDEAEQ